MKVLWVIPGFGEPHENEKRAILEKNKRMVGAGIHLEIYGYDLTHPGVVGHFLKKYVPPKRVFGYDMVMVSLDDVELMGEVPWDAIKGALDGGWDLVTPSMTEDSYTVFPHMYQNRVPREITQTTVPEFFCYFMKPKSYATWWGYLRDYNPWLWGMDLTSHCVMGLKSGILKHYTMRHHYHGGSKGDEDRRRYFEEMGVTEEEVSQQPCFFVNK